MSIAAAPRKLTPLPRTLPLSRSPKPHVPALDGLRAIAVLAVISHHFGLPGGQIGWLGVDMFFVLSGFLITTLLCREHDLTGSINFPRFWLRRACRLLPIYLLYASFITAIILLTGAAHWSPQSVWTPTLFIASLFAYFVNLAPGGLFPQQNLTWHLWSLSIEEQFYFAWPFLCAALLRTRRPWLFPAIFTAAAIALFSIPVHSPSTFRNSYVRTEGILIGCAIALYFQFRQSGILWRTLRNKNFRIATLTLCLLFTFIGYLAMRRPDPGTRDSLTLWLVPAFLFPFASLVASLWYGPHDRLTKFLSISPLAYLGRISYGLYLYHMICIPFAHWLAPHFSPHPSFLLTTTLYLTITLTLASASYHLLERPFLAYKDRLTPTPKRPASSIHPLPIRSPLSIAPT